MSENQNFNLGHSSKRISLIFYKIYHLVSIITFFFRDTGITIQISLYQLCTEWASFFVMIILTLESGFMKNYIDRSITFIRIGEISNVFVMFVIQPLFFLNGDPNFRQSHKIKWSHPADLKISQIFEKNQEWF